MNVSAKRKAEWPNNLIKDVFGKDVIGGPLTEEHENDIVAEILSLGQPGERLLAFYRDGETYAKIGEDFGVTGSAVRTSVDGAIRELRRGPRSQILRYGRRLAQLENEVCRKEAELEQRQKDLEAYAARLDLIECELERRREMLRKRWTDECHGGTTSPEDLPPELATKYRAQLGTLPVGQMGLSVRSTHNLLRANINTLDDVIGALKARKLSSIHNLGAVSVREIVNKVWHMTGEDYSNCI